MKTHKGGIKQRKIEAKQVDLYPISNTERCPVVIIMRYLWKLPVNRTCGAFYLQPKKKFTEFNWYLDRPCGVNKLRDTVKDMCKNAGLSGFYTNHSLRSTAATNMYRSDIDEQFIQEITGHRSLAVRSYKRTSDHQRRVTSNCIFSQ